MPIRNNVVIDSFDSNAQIMNNRYLPHPNQQYIQANHLDFAHKNENWF